MAATAQMSCGCSTTRSMFGEYEILSVIPCPKHALELQSELKALQEKMFILLQKPTKDGKEKSN